MTDLSSLRVVAVLEVSPSLGSEIPSLIKSSNAWNRQHFEKREYFMKKRENCLLFVSVDACTLLFSNLHLVFRSPGTGCKVVLLACRMNDVSYKSADRRCGPADKMRLRDEAAELGGACSITP